MDVPRQSVETLTPAEVAQALPGAIDYDNRYRVAVCGANCPDKDEVTVELRRAGVSVENSARCLGGCATKKLVSGAYVLDPQLTQTQGYEPQIVEVTC